MGYVVSRTRAGVSTALRKALRTARGAKAVLIGTAPKTAAQYLGYLEGFSEDGLLRGWVLKRDGGLGLQSVGLYAGEELLDTLTADLPRKDVRAEIGGDETCGFAFEVTELHEVAIRQAGGTVSVRVMDGQDQLIGTLNLPEAPDATAVPDADTRAIERFAVLLKDDIARLTELLETVPEAPAAAPTAAAAVPEARPQEAPPAPTFTRHSAMFSPDRVIPDIPWSGQSAYLDYVRYRYRMDQQFEVEPELEAQDRYLYWYLTAYRSHDRRRVPLSAETLSYLNAPLIMAGQPYTMSRMMWWRFAGRKDLLSQTDLSSRDGYLDVLFWWAHHEAPQLYFEDCLVPDRMADLLRGVHPSRRFDAFPWSYFSERFYQDTKALQFLDPTRDASRKMVALCMIVMAARRPDLLRYLPAGVLNDLLSPEKNPATGAPGPSALARFVQELRVAIAQRDDPAADAAALPPLPLSQDHLVAALRQAHFDLPSKRFLTRDPAGNRFEAAALPGPDPSRPEVDVQLIGPLAKASGLGQATRLSAEILRHTGLSMRGVDFDLDNPAPEGFSSDTLIEEYGPAKINIIHLNAESIPLAFAYQPDVFSGRYNIGYFFWELDKPAYCHYLGMGLLDEIWVSTEYGVSIYQPDSDGKPVKNVGMCYEDLSDIDRRASRDFVNGRFGLNDAHHICLVAFDSFSFVQRKNPVAVLRAFQEAFEGVPNARLIVKTQNRDNVFDPPQVKLWDRVDALVAKDPRILIMNETLSYRDLLRLKAGSDCYVSLHKSEGWGFGMIEAMNLGVPVVCTGYSGNMDFCSEDTAWLVRYQEAPLKPEDYIFVRPGSKWAEPSVSDAARQMRAIYDTPAAAQAKVAAAQSHIQTHFSPQAIAQRYGGRLREILKEL